MEEKYLQMLSAIQNHICSLAVGGNTSNPLLLLEYCQENVNHFDKFSHTDIIPLIKVF